MYVKTILLSFNVICVGNKHWKIEFSEQPKCNIEFENVNFMRKLSKSKFAMETYEIKMEKQLNANFPWDVSFVKVNEIDEEQQQQQRRR